MAGTFYIRLRDYYRSVGEVLRGEANAGSIFPNSTDVGQSRERVYEEFLRQHVPSKCNVFCGGFLFGADGTESSQLDVIVTVDTAPRFNFHNKDGRGKSFSPVDGTLAAVSVKSKLDKRELEDSLKGFASIPEVSESNCRISPFIKFGDRKFADWPFKIIYATKSISEDSLLSHLNEFYSRHPEIPIGRRPNLIHVCGQFAVIRAVRGMGAWNHKKKHQVPFEIDKFYSMHGEPDVTAILWTLENIQKKATISAQVLYVYDGLLNNVLGIPPNLDDLTTGDNDEPDLRPVH